MTLSLPENALTKGADLDSPEVEIQLFHALMSHKPVGADRHFQMICLSRLLNSHQTDQTITTDLIWNKLDSLYNMDELVGWSR